MYSPSRTVSTSDYVGIASAVICMLHCIAAPLVFGAANHAHHHWDFVLAEQWNYVFLALGFVAVLWSTRHAHGKVIKWALWITYAALAMAILMESFAEELHLHFLVYGASTALIVAHLVNLRKHIKRNKAA